MKQLVPIGDTGDSEMKKTRTIVRAIHPSGLPGELKPVGGSNSDS
jgi:hypothetical protein